VAFCRSDPASHVVLIAPRCGAELTQDPEGCQQVWLLCIGKCSEAELNGLLFNLSRRGSLRWDVKQCYSINRRCRGVGGQGAVFTGTSRTKVADFQDSRILRELRGQLTLPGLHDLDEAAVKVWGNGSLAAFHSEAGHLQKMGGHPNISTLLGVFCELGEDSAQRPQWVMVMELCPGGDLFDLVSDGVIPQENVLQIMVGVFSALTYAHAHNVVHRDVKAENVVLHGERAVLIDFGIACCIDDTEEMRRRVGSPGYVAPEIIRGKRYNELVDTFAAGVIVYFLLCGRLPFAAEQQDAILEKTVKCEVNYSSEALCRVTPPLLNLLRQMLNPHASSRPSARSCFDNVNAIASRAVRMSEAFTIAKKALASLDDAGTAGLADSPSRPHARSTSSAYSASQDPQETSLLRSCSLASFERPERQTSGQSGPAPSRSGSTSVWQLLQELPSAARRSIQRISNSGSFTAMRQICNVAGDLPKVALAKLTSSRESVCMSVRSNSADSERVNTMQLDPIVPESAQAQSQPVLRPVQRRPRTGSRLTVPCRSGSKEAVRPVPPPPHEEAVRARPDIRVEYSKTWQTALAVLMEGRKEKCKVYNRHNRLVSLTGELEQRDFPLKVVFLEEVASIVYCPNWEIILESFLESSDLEDYIILDRSNKEFLLDSANRDRDCFPIRLLAKVKEQDPVFESLEVDIQRSRHGSV